MTIAGLLLIVASILKAHEILTEPVMSKGFWESWLFFVIQIPLELGLGIWLVSGLFRKAAWLLATISFAGFIGVTLWKGITGQASCGCFGKIQVNPWITLFAMDVPVFLLLLIFRPKGEKLLPPPWPHPAHFIPVAMVTCLLLGALVPTLVFNKPGDEGIGRGGQQYIVIKPDNWTSSESGPQHSFDAAGAQESDFAEKISGNIPSWQLMLEHIDIAEQLKSGAVVVLFYHWDCPDCKDAIPLYEQYSRQLSSAADDQIKFAFINAPPYGTESQEIVSKDTSAMVGRLDESRKWIFETPLIFLLSDGKLIHWWQVKYPDINELLETILTLH